MFLYFISILLILCLPNVSNKTYQDKIENQLCAEHIVGLASITLCQIMDQLWSKLGDHLYFSGFSLLYLSIFLHKCFKISYHDIGGYQLSEQHKRSTG